MQVGAGGVPENDTSVTATPLTVTSPVLVTVNV
jgi:hypothetical protein